MLLCAVLAFLFVNSALRAQGYMMQMQPPEERAKRMTEWMTTNLKLTGDQVPKVQDINLRYAQKMEGIKMGSQTKEEKRGQVKSLSDQKDGEMKTVLNDDQYQSYLARKKEMEKRMKEKMKERS